MSLGPGEYSFSVYQSEESIRFSALTRHFTLAAHEQKTVTLSENMGTHSLSGWPTPFKMIDLHLQIDWEYTSLTTYTGADGQYLAEVLPLGVKWC